MSVLCGIGSEFDRPFGHCFKEFEYENDSSTIMYCFKGQQLPVIGLSLGVLRCPFSHLLFAERFDY